MFENYIHTLIAISKTFTPSPESIATFYSRILEEGVLGSPAEFSLFKPTGEIREFRNPFTGEVITVPRKSCEGVADLGQIRSALDDVTDYKFQAVSTSLPKAPPLPISFAQPYSLTISCVCRPILVSTSDVLGQAVPDVTIVPYDEPCTESDAEWGYFPNLSTGAPTKVAKAGGARFRIEFELGKFLTPEFNGADGFDILNPRVVELAEQSFGTSFVQGCHFA